MVAGTAQPAVRSARGRRASPVLWLLAGAAVLPSLIPIGLLVWTTITAGADPGGIPVSRLGELAASTAVLVVGVTVGAGVIGMGTAWITTRTNLPRRKLWATLVSVPLVIPSYVGALSLLGAGGNQGALSQVLTAIGLPALPQIRGGWAAWAALTLWNYPFVHLLVTSVLTRMDPALEEAARGLGASRRRAFFTIVVPQARPALTSSMLLVALYTLSDFGAVSLLGYETFTRAIYTQFRGRIDITPALFLSGVLMVLALVLVAAERRGRGAKVLRTERPARSPRIVTLSLRQRIAARVFMGTVVAGALALPAGVLAWWAARGITDNLGSISVGAETANAVTAAAIAAIVTVVAAIPVGVLTVRHPGRASGLLESVTWSTYSLPHLAVGLGFLVFALRVAPFAYQSLPLLVTAYLAMFLPQALGAVQSALRRVGSHLEEASRSLGHRPWVGFRRVVLPVIAPGMLTGGALVFLTTMKELPATLMLRPTGFETLAVRIWSTASEGLYTRASVASLVLLTISAAPVYILVTRDLE
ncbi:MAG: iron ABC transporter permease [Acidimicrobiia bacterium]|nr:iron ABC transporter permease [Acidimicrobiia bacterium]